MLRHSLLRRREATNQEFLQSINSNGSANVETQSDVGWVDSLPASSDTTAVCGFITDFTLLTPVSSPPAQKKWCRVITYIQEHTIQWQVLNWFSWNSHAWCGSTHGWTLLFLETISQIEPLIWGKMGPQNQFFGFHSASMEFFMEKTYKQYVVPHSSQKRFN